MYVEQRPVIRRATCKDLPDMVDLWWLQACHVESASGRKYLRDERTCKDVMHANLKRSMPWPNWIYLVAKTKGVIAGYMVASVQDAPGKAIHDKELVLHGVFVKRGFRRSGVCRAMYEQTEAFARENGASYIRVDTHVNNTAAIEVYKSLGFAPANLELVKWL
jgi:ribosomal protein S18 acetylase RimI-like enzyme